MDTTQVFSIGGVIISVGAARERPEFDIESPFGAPFLLSMQENVTEEFNIFAM